MDLKKEIESCIRQAGVYHSQGLLNEARMSYMQAGKLIKQHDKSLKNKKLLVSISNKIKQISEEIDRVENAAAMPAMPKKVQDIIKTKFAFSKDSDRGELEGAVALAKFGQFERALNEFKDLISRESIRLEAAKNIIRCHMALDTLDAAISDFEQWMDQSLFDGNQLKKLRVFLEGILKKKGISKALPDISGMAQAAPVSTDEMAPQSHLENDMLDIDISFVGITLDSGERQGETVELDVSFQSGNIINLLISSQDKTMIDYLEPGKELNDVQFYSPIAMFAGTGVVASKSLIESGPKQGDYSVDIQVRSI